MPEKHKPEGLRGTPDEIIPTPMATARGYTGGPLNELTGTGSVPQSKGYLLPPASLTSLFGGGSGRAQSEPQTQGVPSASQENQAANQAALSELMKDYTAGVSDPTLRAGITPVPSGTAMPVPSQLTRPVGEFKDYPMNQERVVGAGNARARGIGNAITGITNAVGHVMRAEKQKDQDKLSVSTQRLMQSQQAIDMAKQFLSDPNIAPDRKKALMESVEHNTKIMNTMLDDPKLRKDLEKGLNISFTDPSKNDSDAHHGVQAGIKSFSEQFTSQMPQQLGPDPIAATKLQYAVEQQKAGQKLLNAVIPRIMSANSAMERAQYVQFNQNMRQMDQHVFQSWKLSQQFANSKELAQVRHTYRLDEISENIKLMGQKAMELFQNEKLDATVIFNEQQKFFKDMAGIESRITGAQGATVTAIAQLGQALGKATDSDTKQTLTQQIKQMQDFQKNLDLQMKNLQEFKGRYNGVITNLQNLSSGQAPDNGGQSGTGTGSPGSTGGMEAPSFQGGSFNPSTLLYGLPFSSGGALPPVSAADDTDESDESDNPND